MKTRSRYLNWIAFSAVVLFAAPAWCTTVTVAVSPSNPLLELGQEILFSQTAPGAQLGSLFQIAVEDQATNSGTSTPTFTLTIDDVTDNVSATFDGTFTAPKKGGIGGTLSFLGTVTQIHGVDFVTIQQGVYTIGIAPSFDLNAFNVTNSFTTTGIGGPGTGVGKVDLMSGIIVSSVPEPGTWTAVGLGFALLLAAASLRRRSARHQRDS